MVSGPKSCSLSSIATLSRTEVSALKKAGIDNTKELLDATKTTDAQQALATKAGLSCDEISEATHRAELLQVSGLGKKTADFFENAGIESLGQLAGKTADTVRAILAEFAANHPELKYRLPSPKTIASLVAKAQTLAGTVPAKPVEVSEALAKEDACVALNKYIDDVLFSDNPEGAQFREAVLSWRPQSEWPSVQAQFHAGVAQWAQKAETGTDDQIPGSFWFSGDLSGLYTEVKVDKSGEILKVYVEID
jgi:hypothetical protein